MAKANGKRKQMAKANGKRKQNGDRFPSSTGKRKPNVDQTNWRQQLQVNRIKFDDDMKNTYLHNLAECGRKGMTAAMTGVCRLTVNKHIENDPDFAESVDIVIELYNDSIGGEVKRRGCDGWLEPRFIQGVRALEPILNEDGSEMLNAEGKALFRLASVRRFSDRLLELEAKRVDPNYRDKQTIDLNTQGGGVLVAPAGMSAEEFIKHSEAKAAEADRLHAERMKEFEKAREQGDQ